MCIPHHRDLDVEDLRRSLTGAGWPVPTFPPARPGRWNTSRCWMMGETLNGRRSSEGAYPGREDSDCKVTLGADPRTGNAGEGAGGAGPAGAKSGEGGGLRRAAAVKLILETINR